MIKTKEFEIAESKREKLLTDIQIATEERIEKTELALEMDKELLKYVNKQLDKK